MLEAVYVAGATCCAQLLWLRQQLSDYGVEITHSPIFCENTSAISISKDPIMFSRTKNVEIRFHFLRDNVENVYVTLKYCPTENQVVEVFTKALHRTSFVKQWLELGMMSLS